MTYSETGSVEPKMTPTSNEMPAGVSTQVYPLFRALAGFQQECPPILKNESGYGYKYADLPAILEVINPLMRKYNLGFYQAMDGEYLRTVIFHTLSGESIESSSDLMLDTLEYSEVQKKDNTVWQIRGFEAMNRAQALGALTTYVRRYALTCLLGIVSDKDTDGAGTSPSPQTQSTSIRR
jgi:hypothetical protein